MVSQAHCPKTGKRGEVSKGREAGLKGNPAQGQSKDNAGTLTSEGGSQVCSLVGWTLASTTSTEQGTRAWRETVLVTVSGHNITDP